MGDSTPFPQVGASIKPPLGSSWETGTRLVRIRQIKHALSCHQTPVAVARSDNYHSPHAGDVELATIATLFRKLVSPPPIKNVFSQASDNSSLVSELLLSEV